MANMVLHVTSIVRVHHAVGGGARLNIEASDLVHLSQWTLVFQFNSNNHTEFQSPIPLSLTKPEQLPFYHFPFSIEFQQMNLG